MKAILDDNPLAPWRGTGPATVVLGELEIRPALPAEMQRIATLLNDEHYLGAGRQVGRTLVQIVHHRERWAAILVWGPAAMKLIDRDAWIGWTQRQRTERLGLIVQNRRFLVLAETRLPNLASRAMGLALRQLPDQWQEKHGYRPLLAETFTDIESFEGTCYKASKQPKSEASKTEGELTAAKRLYQSVDLRNAVVTGDALHCERENMQLIIAHDGDFLFQLKGNQPTALAEAHRIAAAGSPLLAATRKIAGTVG